MKKTLIALISMFIHCYTFGQIIFGDQENQSIKINQDITFTGTSGKITLKKMSIQTSGIVTFTDSIVNLEDVTINSDSIVNFTHASTIMNIKNRVDISCKVLNFPSNLLTLNGINIVNKQPTKDSPSFTLRFQSPSVSRFNISSDDILSFSIINKPSK